MVVSYNPYFSVSVLMEFMYPSLLPMYLFPSFPIILSLLSDSILAPLLEHVYTLVICETARCMGVIGSGANWIGYEIWSLNNISIYRKRLKHSRI